MGSVAVRFLVFFLASYLLPLVAWGQLGSLEGPIIESHRSVVGRVTALTGEPVRGARVDITTNAGTRFTSLVTDSRGEFSTDYLLSTVPKEFIVILTVTRKDYPTAHAFANYGASGKPFVIAVVLRKPTNDPTMTSESALIAALVPRLRTLGASDGLSVKNSKAYATAVTQFLDKHRLDLAVPAFERVIALDPGCVRCRVMTGLAEMQWGDWFNAERHFGEAVNAVITNRNLLLPEPWIAYGVWTSWQHRPDKAEPYLQEAVRVAPHDALALQELGRVQCQAMNWEEANVMLANALAAGAGQDARLLHVESLVWAGSAHDANAEMVRYMDGEKDKKLSPYARGIWEKVQERNKDNLALEKMRSRQAAPYLDYVHHPPPELQKLEPVGDQLSLPTILTAVGHNIADLFQNLPNTSSSEIIHQEKLSHNGKNAGSFEQKFRYLCLMPAAEWGPQTEEYRADSRGEPAAPKGLSDNFMLTQGFVAAPLVFHPVYQPGSTFRLLGQEKMGGQEAYVIAFAQDPGRSRLYGKFTDGRTSRNTFYQGVAWVDAQDYRILRLRTDLLAPVPLLKLQVETTNIEFARVHFASIPQGFWLPSTVTVDLDWQGHRLRNRHEYSDFVAFNVKALENTNQRKMSANSPAADQPNTVP